MANRGEEPPPPGHSEAGVLMWCTDGIKVCRPAASEKDVLLALENHWGRPPYLSFSK